MTALILILYPSAILYDCFTLLPKVGRGEKIVYSVLMLISFVLLILYSLDVPIPPLSDFLTDALESLFPQAG